MFSQNFIKSLEYYQKTIFRLVRSIFRGTMDGAEFTFVMENLIMGQMRRAWLEGMAINELSEDDFTQAMQVELDAIVAEEQSHVVEFLDAIMEARANGSLDPMISRAELWTTRYNDVKNRAALFTAEAGQKFEWIYGDTEHCDTCHFLNGKVATADEWRNSGVHPRNPPNPGLKCGGWLCQCEMVPTTKRRTRDIVSILDALGAGVPLEAKNEPAN